MKRGVHPNNVVGNQSHRRAGGACVSDTASEAPLRRWRPPGVKGLTQPVRCGGAGTEIGSIHRRALGLLLRGEARAEVRSQGWNDITGFVPSSFK